MPSFEEVFAFFEQLLAHVKHPVSLSPNPNIGRVTPAMIAPLCRKHSQIVAINLADQNDDYFIKMMMKVFKIPGWGIRGPYLMPSEVEQQHFTAGLLRLRLPEIDALARAAGISLP